MIYNITYNGARREGKTLGATGAEAWDPVLCLRPYERRSPRTPHVVGRYFVFEHIYLSINQFSTRTILKGAFNKFVL